MNRPHRAWLVCLGGALTLLSTIGLGVNVFAVYQPEILALEHFTNAQGSLITTVRSLFILVALLTVNRVCARLGLRRTMTLGVLLIALSASASARPGVLAILRSRRLHRPGLLLRGDGPPVLAHWPVVPRPPESGPGAGLGGQRGGQHRGLPPGGPGH